jgi:hypothetical protein
MKETAEVRRLLRPEKKKAEHFYTYKEGNTEDWLEGKKLYRVKVNRYKKSRIQEHHAEKLSCGFLMHHFSDKMEIAPP